MRLTSNTGLLSSAPQKSAVVKTKSTIELRCEATPAPFILRPYAGLYNPFPHGCSVLCNHPAEPEAKEYVRRAKDAWAFEGKIHNFQEDLSKIQDQYDKEKNRTPHDIVTEDMFRRYTETDSRPLTPAPTLASGKSRGSRRCLTPDQPRQRTTIILDLRRSHSQETLYYHGYGTSELTAGHSAAERSTLQSNMSDSAHGRLLTGDKSPDNLQGKKACTCNIIYLLLFLETLYYHGYGTSELTTGHSAAERSTLQSNISDSAHGRLLTGHCEQLPPLASPLVLAKRNLPVKDLLSERTARKNQLKALNLGKVMKSKNKVETPASERSKGEKDSNASNEAGNNEDTGEVRRRGKRRRKPRGAGSDRLTSAGLAAQAQQDPETQIAGIGTDSHNASSRGSIATAQDVPLPLVVKSTPTSTTDSFLDDDILKYLHREVDEEAIETEFDTKRRYVLKEALRTRMSRPAGPELQSVARELPATCSLADWLHVPRVFSRTNATFALPIDYTALETLSPMSYAARFVTIKKSKQLLYLTVLRKFRPTGYRMPIKNIEEGLILMMGGIMNIDQALQFKCIMEWDSYEEENNYPDEIKLNLLDERYKEQFASEDAELEDNSNTLKYRTWCGLCAICERMYGRYPPREKDPPDGVNISKLVLLNTVFYTTVQRQLDLTQLNENLIFFNIELSDFTMIETKLATLKVHSGLMEILNVIRIR
ncbi:hypothetical protein RR48_04098 [Papilio machaon]|uniref:Uncharacterized protein n=1 Tax=Papilio machaon TaxID=76193 RepID=A0A0N1PHK7_PAPMA|nr:hypothetical protein RR48_04098 [Papilio machaon]